MFKFPLKYFNSIYSILLCMPFEFQIKYLILEFDIAFGKIRIRYIQDVSIKFYLYFLYRILIFPFSVSSQQFRFTEPKILQQSVLWLGGV